MADSDPQTTSENNADQSPETILIAHVTAHLLDGSSFELYPFVDAQDVKSRVSKLAEGWANSGFLLRGSRLIPWHQVKVLEAAPVEEITRQQAQQRLMNWRAEDEIRAVRSFWKTKKKGSDDEGDEEEGGDAEGDKDIENRDE